MTDEISKQETTVRDVMAGKFDVFASNLREFNQALRESAQYIHDTQLNHDMRTVGIPGKDHRVIVTSQNVDEQKANQSGPWDMSMQETVQGYMEERMKADWAAALLPVTPEDRVSIFFCPLCSVKLIERDNAFWCENQNIKFDVYLGLHNRAPQIVMKSV